MYEMCKAEINAVVKVMKSKQFMCCRGGEGGYTENFGKKFRFYNKIRNAV